MNLEILIGVSNYNNAGNLPACKNDINLMHQALESLGKFNDICKISDSPTAREAKNKITEFTNKHKSTPINELVFYYTGHGARFDSEDFFYVFSDFSEKFKETTGLRNTELDGIIRNLSPKLTVKIIDACYSGSSYVKGDIEFQSALEKSAKENTLNKLYFFHSSSSEEESLASDKYSFFTLSFLKAISQNIGPIRHRDIMAYVADDMGAKGHPKPTFVVQADNTEIFGEINENTITLINSSISESPNDEDQKTQAAEMPNHEKSLHEIAKEKSEKEYCTQEEGCKNIEAIKSFFTTEFFTKNINELFEIKFLEITEDQYLPNELEIARWLLKNSDESYFSKPSYKTEKYFTQEYIALPKKPPRRYTNAIYNLESILNPPEEIEYKLEKVEKHKDVLDGIDYTASTPFKALQISFQPKLSSIENYFLTIAIIFSKKSLVIFNSKENLEYKTWDSPGYSKCPDWKFTKLALKNINDIKAACIEISKSTSTFIENDIKSKLIK